MSSSAEDVTPEIAESPPKKVSLKSKIKGLMEEYGPIALVVYLTIFGLTVLGFFIAISAGWDTETSGGHTAKFFAVWAAAKLTQPIRIAATFAITPIASKWWHKR
jgi:hypothetical protein